MEENKYYVGSVMDNLMKDKTYRPYCGNMISRTAPGGCDNPRTVFIGGQFRCPKCGWTSKYPADFIKEYKQKHKL